MKFCPFCGKVLDGNHSFCPYCGQTLSSETQASRNTETQPINVQTKPEQTVLPKPKPRISKRLLIPLLILLVVIGIAAVMIFPSLGGDFTDDTDAIQEAANSVVLLSCYDYYDNLHITGSGFAAFDKDIIITNYHVIEGNVYRIEARREDGSTFLIDSVVSYDKEKDFAILRAPDHNLKPLSTGNSENLHKGEKTVAIGSPIGFANNVSTGIFSSYLNVGSYVTILSTASISHGSSGGALFNNRGEVIGITSGGYESGNDLYYSLPIHYVQDAYNSRSPEDEMTLTEFYGLSEHPYSVSYLLAYGSKLHNQTVTVQGYISGMDTHIFLVPSLESVLHLDLRNDFDLASSVLLRELCSSGLAIDIDPTRNGLPTYGLSPGDYVEIIGTLMYYSQTDVRLNATSIKKLD